MKSPKPDETAVLPAKFRWIVAIALSVFAQFCIISYNYYSGFISGFSPMSFLFRWTYGSILTSIVSFGLISIDYQIIRKLNKRYSWSENTFKRIATEFFLSLLIAIILGAGITFLAHAIDHYKESLSNVLVANVLITSVSNILVVALLEAWMFFREGKMNARKAEELKRELLGIRFEVLKNQINPHFLFNSLNVLSGLVGKDTGKAQTFIEEFAFVYRYVLDTIEKPVVTLEDEMKFTRAYIYLQKIRYGDALQFDIHIESSMLEMLLPPLCLQLLLENAIKHNKVDLQSPLLVEISSEKKYLIIRNNLQPKFSGVKSTGIGLKNLVKRYEMISEEEPVFGIVNGHYQAKVPLIENE